MPAPHRDEGLLALAGCYDVELASRRSLAADPRLAMIPARLQWYVGVTRRDTVTLQTRNAPEFVPDYANRPQRPVVRRMSGDSVEAHFSFGSDESTVLRLKLGRDSLPGIVGGAYLGRLVTVIESVVLHRVPCGIALFGPIPSQP